MNVKAARARGRARLALVFAIALVPNVALAQRGGRGTPVPAEVREEQGFDPAESAGLFVGIRDFVDERFAEVPYAVDDAVDLAHLFVLELGLIAPEKTILSLAGEPQKPRSREYLEDLLTAGARRAEPPTQSSIIELVGNQTKATGAKGVYVVTIATHGFSDQGSQFLAAADSRFRRIARTGIAVQELFDDVGRAGTPRRIVLLDACRERLSPGPRGGPADSLSVMSQAFVDALASAKGQVVLAATTLGGYSYDDPELKNGVFSGAVVDGLRGDAPANERSLITAETLAEYVDSRVRKWVQENRPDHYKPTTGIEKTFGGTAAKMPLAANAEGLERWRQLQARRDAALATLKETFVDSKIISGRDFDKAKGLLSARALGRSLVDLLALVERLDSSEESQRAMLAYLATLPGPQGAAPGPGPYLAAEEPPAGEQRSNQLGLATEAEREPPSVVSTIQPLGRVEVDLAARTWKGVWPTQRAFSLVFDAPFDYDSVVVHQATFEELPHCDDFFSPSDDPLARPTSSPLGEVERLGQASPIYEAGLRRMQIRMKPVSPDLYYCFHFSATTSLHPVDLEDLHQAFERAIDEELREWRGFQGHVTTGAVSVAQLEEFEALRSTLAALVKSKAGVEQIAKVPSDSILNADAPGLGDAFADYRQQLDSIADLTVAAKLAAIASFEAKVEEAAVIVGQLSELQVELVDGTSLSLRLALAKFDSEGAAMTRFLGLPPRRQKELIAGGPEGADLRGIWEETADQSPIQDRLKSMRELADDVWTLTELPEAASLATEATTRIEEAMGSLRSLQGVLETRSKAIAELARQLTAEAESVQLASSFLLAVP